MIEDQDNWEIHDAEVARAEARQIEGVLHEVDVIPGIVIRPGDVLVIGCEQRMDENTAARLRAGLLERMPGLADVVILTPPLTVAAVYRRDE